jgi:hypothetical protein
MDIDTVPKIKLDSLLTSEDPYGLTMRPSPAPAASSALPIQLPFKNSINTNYDSIRWSFKKL